MLQGYNIKRPTKVNYERFVSRLVEPLEELDIKGMGLMLWGSFIRKDVQYGRSDIDATWMMPGDVVIDKAVMRACSEVLCEAQRDNHIPFDDITVLDKTIMEDGRFSTYGEDFGQYFEGNGEVVVGEDPRPHMRHYSLISGKMHNIAFNLRSLRAGLLFAQYNKYLQESGLDDEALVRSFDANFKKASRMSKQICDLYDGGVHHNRFSGIERIREYFPEVSVGIFEVIKGYYAHLDVLDTVRRLDSEGMISFMEHSTDAVERLIYSYILCKSPDRDCNVVFNDKK